MAERKAAKLSSGYVRHLPSSFSISYVLKAFVPTFIFPHSPSSGRKAFGDLTTRRLRQFCDHDHMPTRIAWHKATSNTGVVMRKLFIFSALVFALVTGATATVVATTLQSQGAIADIRHWARPGSISPSQASKRRCGILGGEISHLSFGLTGPIRAAPHPPTPLPPGPKEPTS